MKVKNLRARLASFDDGVEVYVAPYITAIRVGEGREMKVAHPLLQHRIADLHVVGDVDPKSQETANRRIVLGFYDPSVEAKSAELAGEIVSERSFSGELGPMSWKGYEAEDSDLIRVQLSGKFSVKALEAMYAGLVSQSWIKQSKRILFDDRLVDLSGITEADLIASSEALLRHAAALRPSRIAIIIGSLDGFRKVCYLELIVASRTEASVQGFLDEQEAVDWLLN